MISEEGNEVEVTNLRKPIIYKAFLILQSVWKYNEFVRILIFEHFLTLGVSILVLASEVMHISTEKLNTLMRHYLIAGCLCSCDD